MSNNNFVKIRPALVVVDMQNCFMAPGGSFDKMKFNIEDYRSVIPAAKKTISAVRKAGVPIFFTRAIREVSGVDLLDRVHKILPKQRRERIRREHLCVRGTWDGDLIEELGDTKKDHIVNKRRDSAFHGTELQVWLDAMNIDTLVFAGVDTSICVESTLRDAFNIGYDVILLSDLTASRTPKNYSTTLDEVRENFGLVLSSEEFLRRLKPQKDMFVFKLD